MEFLFWVFIGIPAICLLAQFAIGLVMSLGLGIYVACGGEIEGDK